LCAGTGGFGFISGSLSGCGWLVCSGREELVRQASIAFPAFFTFGMLQKIMQSAPLCEPVFE